MAKTVKGKNFTWRLSDTPIGSGDAGEVYAVTCVDQPNLEGVLKKPARIATGGTIQRQANQIAQEHRALTRLNGLPQGKAHPPRLLDQADELSEGTANYFIVSETAPGKDLAAMLAQNRQNGKPFPRRVIITVLDALFDLFSRAHKAGVLWNDIKLEHIYWHNPTGIVSVIDWGNAHFLENTPGQSRPPLPRWEDYRQMVDTLGSFLKHNAPELYADLGWDEFEEGELDSPRISILARRIAYQQQVVALKVMEFQSLIRVILTSSPTLMGLQKIREYQQILTTIGAPWEEEGVLNYSQVLINTALAENKIQTAVTTISIVWEVFGETLDLSWHLLREFFRSPDFLTHPSLSAIVKSTLNENWGRVLWLIVVLGRDIKTPSWWDRLVPVLRQKSTNLSPPTPYQTGQALLKWINEQSLETSFPKNKLNTILKDWRTVGDDLKDSPFDYALLELVRDGTALPRHILQSIRQSFAAGETIIRDLLKAWESNDRESLQELFERFTAWDPDRWGIIQLAEEINRFEDWLQVLYEGPTTDVDVRKFLQNLRGNRPPVDRLLGSPPWFLSLIHMFNAVQQGKSIVEYQSVVQNWCPWLLKTSDIAAKKRSSSHHETTEIPVQKIFTQHLKSFSGIEPTLLKVKQQTPHLYANYRKLADGFQEVFSPKVNLQQLELIFQSNPPAGQIESCKAFQALIDWRKHVEQKDYDSALEALKPQHFADWHIIQHTNTVTKDWTDTVLPWLKLIFNINHSSDNASLQHLPQSLMDISLACDEIYLAWKRIVDQNLSTPVLENFEEIIEKARTLFSAWVDSVKQKDDPVSQLLLLQNSELIHHVLENFISLIEYSGLLKIDILALGARDDLTMSTKIQAGKNIFEHLNAIEQILVTDPQERLVPDWHQAYARLHETKFPEGGREMVSSLPDSHTLFTWLMQLIFTE